MSARLLVQDLPVRIVRLGAVIGGLNTRRGTIIDSEVRDDEFTCIAEVALNDMFGYSNQLRGSTQGKGEFSMEYKVSWEYFCEGFEINISCFRHICQFFLTFKRKWKTLIERRYLKPRSRGSLYIEVQ